MTAKDRDDVSGLPEAQFETGSLRRELKNLLGITSKREMDRMEGREQVRVLEDVAGLYDRERDCWLCTLTTYQVEIGWSMLPQCAPAWTAITNR
ncbi:MAG TPA: hypothetical protein VK901_22605 [Nitrospiraceae bacterium]|nr:hypothetical protein [Nitrospiraceae bacterium]